MRKNSVGDDITPSVLKAENLFSFPSIIFDEQFTFAVSFLAKQAKKKICISTFKFEVCRKPRGATLQRCINDLVSAQKRGVEINVLLNFALDYKSTSPGNLAAAIFLFNLGFDVRYIPNGRCCHGKLFIIDDSFLLVGSHNFSVRSCISNFEVSVLLDDSNIILKAREKFTSLFSRSSRFNFQKSV